MARYVLKKNDRNEMGIYDKTEKKWITGLLSDIHRMNKKENEQEHRKLKSKK